MTLSPLQFAAWLAAGCRGLLISSLVSDYAALELSNVGVMCSVLTILTTRGYSHTGKSFVNQTQEEKLINISSNECQPSNENKIVKESQGSIFPSLFNIRKSSLKVWDYVEYLLFSVYVNPCTCKVGYWKQKANIGYNDKVKVVMIRKSKALTISQIYIISSTDVLFLEMSWTHLYSDKYELCWHYRLRLCR